MFHDRQIPNFPRPSTLFPRRFKNFFSVPKFKDFSRQALNSTPLQEPWFILPDQFPKDPNIHHKMGDITSGWVGNRRSGVALATCQTLVVLHLRAQGLGEGDEHPPTLSCGVCSTLPYLTYHATHVTKLLLLNKWQLVHTLLYSVCQCLTGL